MATHATPAAGRQTHRSTRIDLLRWPVLGRFLKWRYARVAMQTVLLAAAGFMLFDGLVGPQLAPKNLATTGAWLEYRGLVILALLVAGNLFCMACPFMLPRRAGRWLREHVLGGGRRVPRILRNKWLAVGLTVVFFYTYERYSLWASPWLTAWLAAGYFLAAFVVDTWFEGAAFCKYVCPLGQFNFFSSLISPFEIKVREPSVCSSCATKDCILGRQASTLPTSLSPPSEKGNAAPRSLTVGRVAGGEGGLRGCELYLFQPAKSGNMDCTFCLDCVHACPYDNVGLIGRAPTSELWDDPQRSGIGRFSRRRDLAALVVLLTFASFINAFNMIRPVYGLRAYLEAHLGLQPGATLALTFLIGLGILPILLVLGAGWAGRRLGRLEEPLLRVVNSYVYILVPLGFGMWLAHYTFHFLTGGLTVVPVVQSFLADVGLYRGPVQWGLGPVVPLSWLFPIEAVFLYLGATGSVVVAFQIAQGIAQKASAAMPANLKSNTLRFALYAVLPWVILSLLLLAAGLWILIQPMEMRGTMMMIPGG